MECPICLSSFTQPVIASDGLTYDLDCLRLWYRPHRTSPMTKSLISQFVYRNSTICKSMNISIPSNEHFDLSKDIKWGDSKTEGIPDKIYEEEPIPSEYIYEEIDSDVQNKSGLYTMIILSFVFYFPSFYSSFGSWGIIFLSLIFALLLFFIYRL